jgi:hypothetical protein
VSVPIDSATRFDYPTSAVRNHLSLLLLATLGLVGCNATATAQTGPVNVNTASGSTSSVVVQGNTASAEGARPSTAITVPVAVAPNSNAAVGSISTTPASTPSADAGADVAR